ncbi:MAG: GYD domain-containing protein [Solirubrobacteraceae bacterium]
MAKFLVKASYTTEGAKGVQRAGGTSRRDAVARMAEGLGGKLESFYFAFGETDAYVVLDLPDNQSAAAASMAVNAAGSATSEVVVLLTPENIDAAAKLSVDYRAPGS